jgi:acetyl esterase/lipase
MSKRRIGCVLGSVLLVIPNVPAPAAEQSAGPGAPAVAGARGVRGGGVSNPEDLAYPARASEAFKQTGIPAPTLLWPNGAPNAKGDSDEDKPAIYPFLPAKDKHTGCAVIVAPGGAFTHRAMDQEGVTFGKWFAERGIAAFVLRYRIQPLYSRPDYTLDGQRAVQFIKAHAVEYGIAPDRVGIIGFSAGSSLAAYTAYQVLAPKAEAEDVVERQSSRIAFMILAYGSALPPANFDLREVPPTFMFATEEDRRMATGMLSLYRTLVDAEVPAEIHVFPNGEHGTGLSPGDRQIGEWPNLMYRWLQAGNFLSAEPRAAVRGHVLLDGKPLPHGSVTFVPLDDHPAGSHAPRTAFVMNTDTPTADFTLGAKVGPAVGRYKVEVRQDAAVWVSNNRDPARVTSMSPAERAAFIRTSGWGLPTIDGTIRVYTKAHPGDPADLTVEIKPGDNEFNIEVFSK